MKPRLIPLLVALLAFGVLVASAMHVAGQGPEPMEWVVFMEHGPDGFAVQELNIASARGAELVQSIPFFNAHVVRASEAYWLVLDRMPGVRRVVPNVDFSIDPDLAHTSIDGAPPAVSVTLTRVSPTTDLGKIPIGQQSTAQLKLTNIGLTVLSNMSVLLENLDVPQGAMLTIEEPGPGEYRVEWLDPLTQEWTSLGGEPAALPTEFSIPIAGQATIQVRVTLGGPGPVGNYSFAHTINAEDGGPVTAANIAAVPWPLARVDANLVWPASTGEGVRVAVLDTGIDDRWGELTVAGGCNAVGHTTCVEGGWEDDHGHGTMVASLIAANSSSGDIGLTGMAPNAELYSLKVCGSTGSCTFADVLQGLAWAQANGIHIANMSLGAQLSHGPTINAVCGAMSEAMENGMILVAASGNDAGPVQYPAACGSVIAVGSITADDGLSPFSSRGAEMAAWGLVAPGQQLFLLNLLDSVSVSSGTSLAAPIVAGSAALLLGGNADLTPQQTFALLADTAVDLGLPPEQQGAGLISVRAAWEAAQ